MECDLFLRDHSPSLEQPEKFAIDIVVVSLTVKNWLGETLLPQDALPEARIIQFSCLTPQGTAISYTLADIALELLKRLDVVRSESPNRPILFIGHEIGGLIVKMILVSKSPLRPASSSTVRMTIGVVFFDTKHPVDGNSSGPPYDQEVPHLIEEHSNFIALVNKYLILIHSLCIVATTDKSEVVASGENSIVPGFPATTISAADARPAGLNELSLFGFRKLHEIILALIQNAHSIVRARDIDDGSPGTENALTVQDEELLHSISSIDSKIILSQLLERIFWNYDPSIMSDPCLTKWLNEPRSQVLWLHGDRGVGKTSVTAFLIRELSSIQKLRDKIDNQRSQKSNYSGNILAYFFCRSSESNQQSASDVLLNLLSQILQQRPDLISLFRLRWKQQVRGMKALSLDDELRQLWGHIQWLLQHDSIETAYLLIDGLDDCHESCVNLLNLLECYIIDMQPSFRQPKVLPTSLVNIPEATSNPLVPLRLRGGGLPGPPPPPPPPPLRGGAPGPGPGSRRFSLPIRTVSSREVNLENPQQTRYSDLTPKSKFESQTMLTEEACRQRLTSYEAHTITKVRFPQNSQENSTWAVAEFTKLPLSQDEIIKQIEKLNISRLSVEEKTAALSLYQQKQIFELLNARRSMERDDCFEWSHVQIARKEREVRVGLRETTLIEVYMKRSPGRNINSRNLFNRLQRVEGDLPVKMSKPPISSQQPRQPPPLLQSHPRSQQLKPQPQPQPRPPPALLSINRRYYSEESSKSQHDPSVASYRARRVRVLGRKPIRVRRHRELTSWSTLDSSSGSGSLYMSDTSSDSETEIIPKPEVVIGRGPPKQPEQTKKIGICITSRDKEIFRSRLPGAEYICIEMNDEEQFQRQLLRYVFELSGYDQKFKEELIPILVKKAKGRLPFVKLAVQEIKRIGSFRSPQLVLEMIPTRLEEFYEIGLERSNNWSDKDVRRALAFMAVALEPLKPVELDIMTRLSHESSQIFLSLEHFVKATGYILDISDDARISFIDDTARVFTRAFFKEEQISLFHGMAAQRCLDYITNPELWTNSPSYLHYPVAFWIEHSRLTTQQAGNPVDLNNEFFQRHSRLRSKWFQAYWVIKYSRADEPSGFTLVHILAESGFYQLAQKLAKFDEERWVEESNSLDSQGNTPLHWASRNGHLEVLKELMPKTDDRDRVNFDELTPLHFAVLGGHHQIAKFLIEEGADIHSKARNARTMLHSAANKGDEKMVEILLNEGAFIDATDMDGYTAQNIAKVSSHGNIVDLIETFKSKRLSTTSLKDSERIDRYFFGAVVDFLNPGSWRYFNKKVSVDRILSIESFDSIMATSSGELVPEDERSMTGPDGTQTPLRWLHLPANNMRWVEASIIMNKHFSNRKMLDAASSILRPEAWAERQHRGIETLVQGRFMKPGCQMVSKSIFSRQERSNDDSGYFLTIPYLNWASERETSSLNSIINFVKESSGSSIAVDRLDRYQKLVLNYLNDEHPLHVRRTLDQFYYSTLDTTEQRDVDQVPQKYFQKYCEGSKMRPVLMVDQLWLWVLGRDTVITCFPQRWIESKKDDLGADDKTDVLENIFQRLDENTAAITDANKLAELIIYECSRLCFRVILSQEGTLPFPGCYETIISEVADAETCLFQKFTKALSGEANKHSQGKMEISINEETFHIHQETAQLELIKDVRDELNMIMMVLTDQKKALEEIKTADLSKRGFSSDLFQIIHQHEYELTRLDERAEKVYIALKNLLDLKQKQANVVEARSQRHQAEQTATQGKAIMLFTIITIIFQPLSFMASFFALQIAEFPKLTIGFVLKYMLPISASLFVFCILVVLNFDAVSNLKKKLGKWWRVDSNGWNGMGFREKGRKGTDKKVAEGDVEQGERREW